MARRSLTAVCDLNVMPDGNALEIADYQARLDAVLQMPLTGVSEDKLNQQS